MSSRSLTPGQACPRCSNSSARASSLGRSCARKCRSAQPIHPNPSRRRFSGVRFRETTDHCLATVLAGRDGPEVSTRVREESEKQHQRDIASRRADGARSSASRWTEVVAQLNDVQRPHLEALRQLSIDADPEAREELKWNLPVDVRGDKTNLWMLQNFKDHCSLRFPSPFFATHKATDEDAGSEAGAGFIKLPYERELPTELLQALTQARIKEYVTTGAGWNDR
jgi:uncharacterized protein YdhG (YjbR/CyaY superfamily)